jgi:hypothetical protein
MNRKGLLSLILAAGLMLLGLVPESTARTHHHYRVRHARIHEGHHHKRHHHHSKVKKIASIGAPIAIGAAFGPAGSVGYQVVKHRKAIKHHLMPH